MTCQVLLKFAKESTTKSKGTAGRNLAAAAEDSKVGRPVRSTDVHSMHRNGRGRPARSTGPVDRRALSTGTQLSGLSGSTGRSTGQRGLFTTEVSGLSGSTGRSTGQRGLFTTEVSGFLGRPLGRPEEEVGRPPGRPTDGFWVKIC